MDNIIQIEVNYFESHYDDQFVHLVFVDQGAEVYELSKDQFLQKISIPDNVKWIFAPGKIIEMVDSVPYSSFEA